MAGVEGVGAGDAMIWGQNGGAVTWQAVEGVGAGDAMIWGQNGGCGDVAGEEAAVTDEHPVVASAVASC